MCNSFNMVLAKVGEFVRILDEATNVEHYSRVAMAADDLVVTTDNEWFIERFGADGWNHCRTRRIVP